MAYSVKRLKTEAGYSSGSDNKHDEYEFDIPNDFYCQTCKVAMNSQLVWDAHISGKKHIKKKASASYGENHRKPRCPPDAKMQQIKVSGIGPTSFPTKSSNEIAQIQKKFDQINDRPVVGLEYISEIWRKNVDLEPVYNCKLCYADCQVVTIIDHVLGSRHYSNYFKLNAREKYDEVISKFQIADKSHLPATMLNKFVRELQHKHGKGLVQVENEVSEEEEEEEKFDIKPKNCPDESEQELTSPANKSESESESEPEQFIELKIKSVDPKAVCEKFVHVDQRAKILKDFKLSNSSRPTYEANPESRRKQLKMISSLVIEHKVKSLSFEEKKKITMELMNHDYSTICTYLNFSDAEREAASMRMNKSLAEK